MRHFLWQLSYPLGHNIVLVDCFRSCLIVILDNVASWVLLALLDHLTRGLALVTFADFFTTREKIQERGRTALRFAGIFVLISFTDKENSLLCPVVVK